MNDYAISFLNDHIPPLKVQCAYYVVVDGALQFYINDFDPVMSLSKDSMWTKVEKVASDA